MPADRDYCRGFFFFFFFGGGGARPPHKRSLLASMYCHSPRRHHEFKTHFCSSAIFLLCPQKDHQVSVQYGCMVVQPSTHEMLHYVEKPDTFNSTFLLLLILLTRPTLLVSETLFFPPFLLRRKTPRGLCGTGAWLCSPARTRCFTTSRSPTPSSVTSLTPAPTSSPQRSSVLSARHVTPPPPFCCIRTVSIMLEVCTFAPAVRAGHPNAAALW